MIHLGYACINSQLPTSSKTFRLANYSDEKMLYTSMSNLKALKEILQWNVKHNIKLFRISSGLIPFGSHEINYGIWKNELKSEFEEIGIYIKNNSLRVSMHPGQYTVLNSPDIQIYHRALKDLQYHCDVLDLLKIDNTHKVIIHGGGVYKNRQKSRTELVERIKKLPNNISDRLIIENDEKNYNAEHILEICMETGLPGILDILHHQCFSSFKDLQLKDLIIKFKETWPLSDRQKIHYSNQAQGKFCGAHSNGIDIDQFSKFYLSIKNLDLDIMLETKDKQDSVLKIQTVFPEFKQ